MSSASLPATVSTVQVVADMATLRTIIGNEKRDVFLKGYYAEGDGGGGQFYWDATSTETDNGGTIIKPTAVSGAGRWKRQQGQKVYASWFGFTESASSAANTSALAMIASYFNSIGSGELEFLPGSYNIWDVIPGAPGFEISSVNNFSISANGASFNIGYLWSGTEVQNVFQFTDCKNISIDPPSFSSTVQPVFQRHLRGPHCLKFLGNCENIFIPRVKAVGVASVISAVALSSSTEAQRSRNIAIGVGYADRCGYGMSWQFSGDDVSVGQWYSFGPHRSYIAYGVRNHSINIESQDQDADDVLIRGYEGKETQKIKVNYVNVNSSGAQSAAPCISIAPGDETAVNIGDIDIDIRAHWPLTGYFGYAMHVYKNNNSGGYDTVDRGHSIDNIRVKGRLSSDYSSAIPLRMFVDGTWGVGESVQNLKISDLLMSGVGSSTIGLYSAKDEVVIQNVKSSGNLYVQGAPSENPVLVINCSAPNLTSGVGDSGYAKYLSCNISSGSLQSEENKTFIDCVVNGNEISDFNKSGRGHLLTSKSLSGDLTGTNNIFFVKLPAGIGAYLTVDYALVADQSDSNPASRDETYGRKSFSATMNSSGVWTIQTAVADEIAQRNLGTASTVSLSLVNGTASGAYIAVSCTAYSGSNARASFVLNVVPMIDGNFLNMFAVKA